MLTLSIPEQREGNGREPRLEVLGAAYFSSNRSSLMEGENFLRYLHIIKESNTAKIYLPLKRPQKKARQGKR